MVTELEAIDTVLPEPSLGWEPMPPVPTGWLEQAWEPLIQALNEDGHLDEDLLDELERRVNMMLGYYKDDERSSAQLNAAETLVIYRRGERLIEEHPHGGDRHSDEFQEAQADLLNSTQKRWTLIARRWDHVWPEIVEAARDGNPARTKWRHAWKLAREHTPARPDLDAEDTERGERLRIWHGDFRERLADLEDGSVDLIVTDPPYPSDDLPLWSDLGREAARLLGPRGLLFAWSGQLFLPEVLRRLEEHLTYGWTFALLMPGTGARIMGRHVAQTWKPIVAFSTGTWPSGEWGDDLLVSPEPNDDEYRWQQNGVPAARLIERYSAPTGLVVDPFLGLGTFGCAAVSAGRRFVGTELDFDRYARAATTILDIAEQS